MSSADDWMHAKLTDYWDAQVGAIEVACERLDQLGDAERELALTEITACVKRHVGVLDREWLIQMSIAFADDLYKSASRMLRFDRDTHDYLVASAVPLLAAFRDRGIRIQYLIDNAWPDWDSAAGLVGTWFGAAGFGFICTQEVARDLMYEARAEGRDLPRADALPALARTEANKVVAEHQQLGASFAHLDMDMETGSFEQAFSVAGAPGVVTMLRSEAPDPATTVKVIWPEGFSPRGG